MSKRTSQLTAADPVEPAARGKPSLHEVRRQMTQERIIESALEVFAAKGYTLATLEDVATTAVLSRPTIYQHFDNKAAILRAAIAELPELRPFLTLIVSAQSRAERREAFEALNEYWHDHLGAVWRFMREASAVDAEIREWVERIAHDQTTVLQKRLEDAGVPAEAARARAFLLWSTWNDYLSRLDHVSAELDRSATVDALTDFFEAALQPTPLDDEAVPRRRPAR